VCAGSYFKKKKQKQTQLGMGLGVVVHDCNTIYLSSGDWEDHSWKPA
jgi:hypothetical protein